MVLGYLRDGHERHGYEIVARYRSLTGVILSPGSVYRELARLARAGQVIAREPAGDVDARRIPYRITDGGRDDFDAWLLAPQCTDGDIVTWALFADRVPVDARTPIIERLKDELWFRSKAFTRNPTLGRTRRTVEPAEYDPSSLLIARRQKRLASEIDFLSELADLLNRIEGPPTRTPRASAAAVAQVKPTPRR